MTLLKNVMEQALELQSKGEPFVLATVVAYKRPQSAKPGSKAIIRQDGTSSGWVGGGCVQPIVLREAKKVLEQGKSKLIIISPDSNHQGWEGVQEYLMACQGGGSLEIYLEPMLPKPTLWIFGHSPVAQVLAHIGKILDYNVSVADPLASKENFSDADAIVTDIDEAKSRIAPDSFVVVATMGDGDEEALSMVAGISAAYIGFVASREKSANLFRYLQDKGVKEADLKRIKSPAGLELGAESLPEIAFSVMAEIIQLRKKQKASAVVKEKSRSEMPVLQVQSEATDPICGMKVDIAAAKYSSKYETKTIYFCCLRCKETFDSAPAKYIQS